LGVDGGRGVDEKGERERLWQGLASGCPPPPQCQTVNDKEKDFQISGLQMVIPSRSSSLHKVDLQRKNKRER
jgi:hypothetical protein